MPHQWVYVDNGGGYPCIGARVYEKISIHSTQYCWESKTALKSKTYFEKGKNTIITSYSNGEVIESFSFNIKE